MIDNISCNLLLFLMAFFYIIQIVYIYVNYDKNISISNIISDDKSKNYILFFMILMGITTIFYEYKRNDTYSLVLISILLISIYALIYFNEDNIIHNIFASIAFIAILLFMVRHCRRESYILYIAVIIQFLLLVVITIIIIYKNNKIFIYETLYLLNFAIFYIYIHTNTNTNT